MPERAGATSVIWERPLRPVLEFLPRRSARKGPSHIALAALGRLPEHDSCFKAAMRERDFFAYCTTLKLLELKAIGELSRVRHLGEGETIYSTGDPGDALFIINRGVVEVIQPSAQKSPATYLSRGDVLGDVETLSGLPRKHVARACEPVSVQCFPVRHFPELIKRVPSFFHFL